MTTKGQQLEVTSLHFFTSRPFRELDCSSSSAYLRKSTRHSASAVAAPATPSARAGAGVGAGAAAVAILAVVSLFAIILPFALAAAAASPADYITQRGSNDRAGYFPNANLDPSVITSGAFGLRAEITLPNVAGRTPGPAFATPLVYSYPSYPSQIVLVATQYNNVFAVDGNNGSVLASRNLEVPFNVATDIPDCGDVEGTVGVTSTPVIDPATDTAYLMTKVRDKKQASGPGCRLQPNTYVNPTASGYLNGRYKMHAIDVKTLAERPNFPIDLEGTQAQNDPYIFFEGGKILQRPALLLQDGIVFAAFGGHCDKYNYTGWIIGVDAASGAVTTAWTATAGPQRRGAGIWMSGGGIAANSAGRLFVTTGNSEASPLNSPTPGSSPPSVLGMAVVSLAVESATKHLSVKDFFTPHDYSDLNGADSDMGAGSCSLLPSYFATTSVPSVAIAGGKIGDLYFLNADNLGGFRMGNANSDKILSMVDAKAAIYSQAGSYPNEGGFVYVTPVGQPMLVFKFTKDASGDPQFTQVAQSKVVGGGLGVGSPQVTSLNGVAGSGIVWLLDFSGTVTAWRAVPNNDGSLDQLFQYTMTGIYPTRKFANLAIGNATVFAASSDGRLFIFGSPTFTPLAASSVEFGTVFVGSSKTMAVKFTALMPVKVVEWSISGAYFSVPNQPVLPVTLAVNQTIAINVQYAPQMTASSSATLSLKTNYTTGANVQVLGFASLHATGQVSGPHLTFSQSSWNFSGTVLGTAASTTTLLVSSDGTADLTVTTVTMPKAPFSILNPPAVGQVLASGSSSALSVIFNATAKGTFQDVFSINSTGGFQKFTIVGTANGPPLLKIYVQNSDGSYTANPPNLNVTFNKQTSWGSQTLNVILGNSKLPLPGTGNITAPESALTEGSKIGPGQNVTIPVTFTSPLIQVTVPDYTSTAEYILNTNDGSGLQTFNFFGTSSAPHSIDPTLSAWSYLNCFQDSGNPHILSTVLTGSLFNTMTVETCLGLCQSGGFAFCGLEYFGECYAGNAVPAAPVIGNCATNATRTSCSGDKTENCGGPSAMDVFWNPKKAGPLPTSTTTSSTSASVTPTATTSPAPSSSPTPGLSNWTYVGCLADNVNNSKTLAGGFQNATTYPVMTIELCAAICIQQNKVDSRLSPGGAFNGNYLFLGVEYSQECYCSGINTFTQVASTGCAMTCKGSANEICGGSSALSVYQYNLLPAAASSSASSSSASVTIGSTQTAPTSTATSTSAPSSPTPSLTNWSYVGCLADNVNNTKTLAGGFQNDTTYPIMTLEICASICIQNNKVDSRLSPGGAFNGNYLFMGVEYSQECYCSGTTTFTRVTSTSCTMTCKGSSSEVCGGPSALSVFQYNLLLATGTSSSSPSASPTPTVSASSLATTSTASTSSGTTTSTSSTNTSPTPSVANWSYIGCLADNINNVKTLAGGFQNDTTYPVMTLELCAAICIQQNKVDSRLSTGGAFNGNYLFMGVEYSQECYCSGISTFTQVASTSCTMACKGNSGEVCGGPSALSVFLYNLLSGTVTSSSSSSASATPTATTAPSSVPTSSGSSGIATGTSSLVSSPTPSVTNWSYVGCLADNVNNTKTLAGGFQNDTTYPIMTLELCASICIQNNKVDSRLSPGGAFNGNYLFMGVEYSQECYCSGTTTFTRVTSTSCTMTCKGSSSEVCGGPSALSVFQYNLLLTTGASSSSPSASPTPTVSASSLATTSTAITASSSPPTSTKSSNTATGTSSAATSPTPSVANWSYVGCLADNLNDTKSLAGGFQNDTTYPVMTLELCATICIQQNKVDYRLSPGGAFNGNYLFMGVEYSQECYCSGLSTFTRVSSSACTMACKGNANEVCGGPSALSVFQYNLLPAGSGSISASSMPLPSNLPSVVNWTYINCLTDLVNGTRLFAGGYQNSTTTPIMTPPLCAAICLSNNGVAKDLNKAKGGAYAGDYLFMGLTYGQECWCSGRNDFAQVPSSACTKPCTGNASWVCGGSKALNVYQYRLLPAPTTSTAK
ncbi:hypothetical protein DFJ73DRAFT_762056 [Zopfochytrium polystomum]|nr:hypothetical protein DFJ73DRAFT_762056 [Zopfochytrium polystomum]